jgi:CheY-like chemotaxis protein
MKTTRTGRILVADDDPASAALYAAWLRLDQHDVRIAVSGAEALTIADELEPDVAVLDIVMPPPDGFALCEIFRRSPRLAHTRIVLITGLQHPANFHRAREVGAADVLIKPCREEALRECVRAVLATRALGA